MMMHPRWSLSSRWLDLNADDEVRILWLFAKLLKNEQQTMFLYWLSFPCFTHWLMLISMGGIISNMCRGQHQGTDVTWGCVAHVSPPHGMYQTFPGRLPVRGKNLFVPRSQMWWMLLMIIRYKYLSRLNVHHRATILSPWWRGMFS